MVDQYHYRSCPECDSLIVVDSVEDEQNCSECRQKIPNDEFDTPPWLEGKDPLKGHVPA